MNTQLPIKEYDTSLEKLEKENFDLKLQISHLKAKLNELTNSSLTFIPTCDCKRTKTETKDVLTDVKKEVEKLLEINEEVKSENAELKNRIEEVFDENSSLRKDCIRLSQHIKEKTAQEEETKQILSQMREEIETVKEELEDMENIKREKAKTEEEYERLSRVAKTMEKEHKSEVDRMKSANTKMQQQNAQLQEIAHQMTQQIEESARSNHQLTNENHSISNQNQKLTQKINSLNGILKNLQDQVEIKAQETYKTKEIGERLVHEIKAKNKQTQAEKEEMEKRAEEIIKDREGKIAQLQMSLNKMNTEVQHNNIQISRIQNVFSEYIKYIAALTGRVANVSTEIDRAKSSQKAFQEEREKVKTDRTKEALEMVKKEKDTLEGIIREAKKEIEKTKSDKNKLLEEREDLINRLHITPSTLKIARDLGVNEFTTINNLFLTWKETKERAEQEAALKNRREEEKRNRKLEEFQTKLQAALSELHFCRNYLEEKKNIIKAIKKQNSNPSLFKKIDISNE
ncbi:hypothetical protein NEMIN01_1430 [Nematocida minor]|uniref:uncharacterized protein n=1 Tax=Nematocida minor TaxID=1912983 RepID=UPI00221E3C04|nr:uncharacterized protein NEMIN01_1430 [Nematocida minor]KAI5191222.1 hypothetical protein NEMIN01_1430 [Nematocida minor]